MLDGILPAPRGVPQVEVTFDLDANGILNVRAQDKGTGKEQKITITASSGLSKDEVSKMQKEAELHAAEDTRHREEIETKNMADTMAYQAEKTLRDNKDKIPADLNADVEAKIAAVKEALKGTNTDAIKNATQALNASMQKIGEAIYRQQPPPGGQQGPGGQQPPPPPPGGEGGQGGQGPKDEGTVEGEFREV
jgi:molecular chaperone DnaK